jgi:hypothetical protein
MSGCFDIGNFADWTSCSLACAEKENLATDPEGFQAAVTNFNCMQKVCFKACNGEVD